MSNLLDKASIILTPTAYNNGEALCVKPSDGSGDFDFSRNSAATRVNAQGLVENVQILSSNLVQNGDFSQEGSELVSGNNSNFDTSTGDWQQFRGVLSWDSSIQAGKWTDNGNTGSPKGFTMSGGVIPTSVGKIYRVKFIAKTNSSSSFNFGWIGETSTFNTVLNPNLTNDFQDYEFTFTTSGNNQRLYIALNSSTIGNGESYWIDNVSVKEVGQNWDLNTGFSIGNNKAILTNGTDSTYQIFQGISGLNTKRLKVTFDISNFSGSAEIRYPLRHNITANGSYSFEGIGDFDRLQFQAKSGATTSFDITNISVIEITTDTNLPRINYEGFSYQDALGSELAVNGDFATDSNWNKDANWSIANGVATSNGFGRMFQSIPFLETNVGTKVKVSFDITERTNGGVVVNCYGGVSQSFTSVGTHTFVTTTINSTNLYFNNNGAGGGFTGSIDNVSVKEYFGQEVVPDSGCGSWLWEPQSTNLITQSELLNLSLNNKVDTTITDNFGVSPSGQLNSSRIQFADATSFCYGIISISTTHTASVYVKGTSGETIRFGIGGNVTTGDLFTFNGLWQRIEYTTASATQIFFSSYGGATATDFEAFGLQLEQQSYATSYIPTDGSTVTRNQDLCTNGGSLASLNSTSGTLYFEGAALSNDGTNRILGLSKDGDATNRINIFYTSGSNKMKFVLRVNNTNVFDTVITLSDIVDYNKVALSFKENEFKVFINGVKEAEQLSGSIYPINTLDKLSFDQGSGSLPFFGKTKALAVWKEALTDAELTELTTI